tara:strand:- start:160 stop:528 length:369 start_codon:yes stop_codon:yes gene_type:complete
MQSYYISGSNVFTIRTANTGSGVLTLELENMLTLVTSSMDIDEYTFNATQGILSFTASLTASQGDEYRAYINDALLTDPVWDGTIQVYREQNTPFSQADYQNQNTSGSYISNNSENEYIILT